MNSTNPRKHPVIGKAAITVLVVSGLLMVVWSFVVPIFESPDEPAHWQYARYIRHNKRLPPYTIEQQEGNSPPLYYLLVSPFTTYSQVPPRFTWAGPDGMEYAGFPRFVENTRADFHRYWPIRVTRLATILISLVTVLFCYLGGLEATRRTSTAVLAGGLVGFLPEFSFRGMSVSNDSLVTALGAVLIYFIIRFIRRGSTVRDRIVAATVMAAAFLSKINAIFFPLPLALSMLKGERQFRSRLARLWVFGISLVMAAPWLIRNQVKYGDPLASGAMLKVVDFLVSRHSLTSGYFTTLFAPMLAKSYVATFGWMNIWAPKWVYAVIGALGVLSVIGLSIGFIRHKLDRQLVGLLTLSLVLNLMVVVYINLTFPQPQGRYLFPSLAAAAVLSSVGLEVLPRWNVAASIVALSVLLLVNVYLLVGIVYPSYWPAPLPDVSMAVSALKVSSTEDISPKEDGDYVIDGPNPRFVVSGDTSTAGFYFLAFSITGPKNGGRITGTVHLYFSGESPEALHEVPFTWVSNGQSEAVYLPLFTRTDWKGRVRRISIEPFAEGAEDHLGSIIIIGDPRLLGSID